MRHPGLQPERAQGQIDLGELCPLQHHVVALDICAAASAGGVQPQPEELIRRVVSSLDILEMPL
jgi:hypothetical protein